MKPQCYSVYYQLGQKNVRINKTGLQKNESSTDTITNMIVSVGNHALHACHSTQVMYFKAVKTL